jgi:hypothetical protein
MGTYLNPGSEKLDIDRAGEIYIDKSELMLTLNKIFGSPQRNVCISRPRRFGKSMAANMISAYYDKTVDGNKAFAGLKILEPQNDNTLMNSCDVIKLNMQEFLSRTDSIEGLLTRLKKIVLRDLFREFPDVDYFDREDLIECLNDIYSIHKQKFVIIIDEWDCIFREYPNDSDAQTKYLDFLRDFLKDKDYVGLAYMTGILPIKKYGTHSALNMFYEYSMEDPESFSSFVGFTEEEVINLCAKYSMDLEECKAWYNGYYFHECGAVYNPNSIVRSMLSGKFSDYWNQTETYEALRVYIDMNFDGLKDSILKLMAGGRQKINTGTFQNDMTSFVTADDVMTLLVHLGYLGYDFETKEVFIPNKEIMQEFVTATTAKDSWDEVVNSVKKSDELLNATWNQEETMVASYIEDAHLETSHLQYNDENALSYTISLAYYAARNYYTVVRELPTGKGFADLAFIPRKKYMDKPAMLIELKWNQDASSAINQILDKNYPESLKDYRGNLLLVGINYDKKTRKHECEITKYSDVKS